MNREKFRTWCLFCGLCLAMHGWAGITLYVVPAGTGGVNPADPFTDWPTAATNIQTAVNAAATNAGFNTVVVSSGVYNLTGQVTIAHGMLVRSWKDGASDRVNTRIVGGAGFRCVELKHAEAVLSGFTITNGDCQKDGAGVYINTAGGTLSNCVVTGNRVTMQGGGIRQAAGLVVDCLIAGNYVEAAGNTIGAGVCASGGQIMDSQIINNCATSAAYAGGGAGMYISGPYAITRCEIAGNTNVCLYAHGGGLYVDNCTNLVVSQTVIKGNRTVHSGGGIAFYKASNVQFHDCEISGNKANTGGGISSMLGGMVSNCLFANCTIKSNVALSSSSGGGVSVARTGTHLIAFKNCLIAGNNGPYSGGGMCVESPVDAIDNCTIAGNSAVVNGGGLFYASNVTTRVNNCIIYDNAAKDGSNVWLVLPESTNCFYYCCAGGLDLPAAQGNHGADPGFAGAGDFRLRPDSLCVNAGSNAPWMNDARELGGYRRIDRFSGRVDMGCYEYHAQGTLYRLY